MTAFLLTGEDWYQRKGTTEAKAPQGVGHWDGGDYSVVEVPYRIGEKVRLTGDEWLDPGTIREITGYRYSSAKEAWLPVLDSGYWVVGDWTVEPVTESGWNIGVEGPVIETGENITDPNAPLPFLTPRADEHPNFVQVSVMVPTFSSEYDKSWSAYREDEYSPWELLSTTIKDATDIKGLRKVLDEIERRIG